jgi:hypothetical protein
MTISRRRRVLGASLIPIGVAGWIEAMFMIFAQINSYMSNYFAWALVPVSGAVVVLGGLLMGLWG